MTADRRRLTLALLISLLLHTLLFSLTFGDEGLGLPGFGLPWRERRIEAADLRVVLMPAAVRATEPVESLPAAAQPDTNTTPATNRTRRANCRLDGKAVEGSRPKTSDTLLRRSQPRHLASAVAATALCPPKQPSMRRLCQSRCRK